MWTKTRIKINLNPKVLFESRPVPVESKQLAQVLYPDPMILSARVARLWPGAHSPPHQSLTLRTPPPLPDSHTETNVRRMRRRRRLSRAEDSLSDDCQYFWNFYRTTASDTEGLRKKSKPSQNVGTPVLRYNNLYPCPRFLLRCKLHNASLSIFREENHVIGTSKTGTGKT